MVEELLRMKMNQPTDKSHFKYDSFITTKSRLKRNGLGEWKSKYNKGILIVTRVS